MTKGEQKSERHRKTQGEEGGRKKKGIDRGGEGEVGDDPGDKGGEERAGSDMLMPLFTRLFKDY